MRLGLETTLLSLVLWGTVPAHGQFVSDPARLTQGRWEAVPCVERFQAVPGSPDTFFLRLHKVGPRRRMAYHAGFATFPDSPDSCATTRDGMVVFWAGIGPKKDRPGAFDTSELLARIGTKQEGYAWALFSYKDGQLVRIATEDVPIALPDLKEAYIRRSFAGLLPFRDHILLFYDNNKFMSFVNGFAAWNGKEFRTLLQLEKPFVLGGENHLLRGIFDWGRTGEGGLWMQVSSKSERGGQFLYTVFDGVKLEARISTKDKWPGTKFDAKPAFSNPVAKTRLNVFVNGMLAKSAGGEFREAILRVQKDRTEPLVNSSDLKERFGLNLVFAFDVLCSSGVDRFLVKASGRESTFGKQREFLIQFNQGKLEKIFDREQADLDKDKPLFIFRGAAMEGANPQFFFTAGTTWEEDSSGSNTIRIVGRPRLYWFDGQTVRLVAKDMLVRHDSLQITESPLGKLLWGEFKQDILQVFIDPGGGIKTELGSPLQRKVVTVSASGATLQDPPRFSLTNSKVDLTLADVVGWISEREALVLAEPGLYRLKRVE